MAARLTLHEAYDFGPMWSPDGSKIAFTSDRHGNDDVFVLHLKEGRVQRLTYWSGRDRAIGWTPDGKSVLLESSRDWEPYGVNSSFYAAPLSGGTPYRMHHVESYNSALSPDSSKIAFVRRESTWTRKRYKSSATGDLWLQDVKTNRFTQLTDFDGPDTQPQWSPDNQTLYYLSERDGAYNLWKMDTRTKRATQLTRYKEEGIRFPRIASNGKLLVYEYQLDLFAIDPTGSAPTPKRLQFTAPANDPRKSEGAWRTFSADISEFQVAPSGKETAFVIRGEIFTTRFPEGGAVKRVTETVPPESGLTWSTNGKHLIYSAEQPNGKSDLFSVEADSPEDPRLRRSETYKVTQLTQTPMNESDPKFSPDGKTLAFQRGNGDLILMDWETKKETTLVSGWSLGQYEWSPDSRWIAYVQSDHEFNNEVFIIPVSGGSPTNISRHPANDFAPSWSGDGKSLAFTSERGSLTGGYNLCHVYLRKEDHEITKADRDDEEDDKHDAPKKPAPKTEPGDTKKPEKEPMVIDLEDIHDRVRQITNYSSSVGAPAMSPDGKKIAFSSSHQGQPDLFVINVDGTEEKRLTTTGVAPSQIRWSADGNSLHFLSRGRISRVAAAGGTPQSANTNAQMRVDFPAEREYIFNAAWQTLDQTFYDPNFHGVNWSQMREKYLPYLPHAVEDRDFQSVVMMMLGELNASHMGFTRPRSFASPDTSDTGSLGVIWSNERSGEGLLIDAILPNTPAARKEVNLKPGERVLAINRQRITANTNVWQLLDRTVGERVSLLVKDNAGNERTVHLRPISLGAHASAHYRAWVKRNQQIVDQKSNGQLAYIHIQGMNEPSLLEFIRQLYAAAYGKKGLLIDVRFNGGGSTADLVLAIINVKRHAYTIPRDGSPGYPQDRLPLPAWTKPVVALCNESSFSNAEIFAHAVKILKRGPVVGVPTAGGVISTGGRMLMDGSTIRTPGRGWYTIDKHINQEGNGAVPDFVVEDLPLDVWENIDRQLDKAIEAGLDAVRNAPPEFPEPKRGK